MFTLGRAFRVPTFPDWDERLRTVNAITRDLAREYRAVLIDMWDHPVNDRPSATPAPPTGLTPPATPWPWPRSGP